MKKKTILIADDNRDDLHVLQTGLEQAGYSVITTDNGQDAKRIAIEKIPDLIILDVFMPQIPGGLVRLSLKEEPRTCEIPVIFLSCLFCEEEIAGQNIMFGDSPTLPKPYDIKKLLKVIETTITKDPASVGRSKT